MSGRDAAGGGLITWAYRFAAKKWPFAPPARPNHGSWTYPAENGPHRSMAKRIKLPAGSTRADGRTGGRCSSARRCRPRRPPRAARRWRCRPRPTRSRLRRASRIRRSGRWTGPGTELRFKRGDALEVQLGNELPVPIGAQLAWASTACRQPSRCWPARRWPQAGKKALQFHCAMPAPSCATSAVGRWPGAAIGGARLDRRRRARQSRSTATRCCCSRTGGCARTGPRSRPGPTPRTPRRSTPSMAELHSKSQSAANERLRLRFINGFQRNVIAVKIEKSRGPGHGDRQPACRTVSGPQRRGGAGAGRPGRRLRRCDPAAGAASSILLHDGNEARPIARLVGSKEPPIRGRAAATGAAAALQRPAGPARPEGRAARRSAARRTAGRLGYARGLHAIGAAGIPRQDRPHRGAGADQPRRDRDGLPPPRPSFPAAGPARRRLEAVLAGYAGDRTRPDPAHRLRRRICRTLADGSRRRPTGPRRGWLRWYSVE